MNKSELESKHIAELHELAAEAGVERYRMLTRAELIEKLAGGNGKAESKPRGERSQRPKRERKPREQQAKRERKPEPKQATEPAPQSQPQPERPKRKRRRRRWGRRRRRGGIREHADRWLEAWNARDLEEIVDCYSEQVEFVLPPLLGDSEDHRIVGREALREHFRHGLELAPNLKVTEESLLVGPSGFAILYRREDGHRAIETVELDRDGLACRARVFYERDQPDD